MVDGGRLRRSGNDEHLIQPVVADGVAVHACCTRAYLTCLPPGAHGGVISTIKHYSLNCNETNRHWLDAIIDPAAHRESDLLAFEIAIERAQPGS